MKAFAVCYLLSSLFAVGISQTNNKDNGSSKSSSKFQTNCAFPTSTSALCTHWPNAKSLNKEVVSLTITMANIGRVSSSMIVNLDLNLIGLQMAKCNISYIEPDAFSTLVSLKEINLSGNRLAYIPPGLFANTIVKIDLSNNYLENLDGSLFQELQYLNVLDLSGNRLSSFPTNLPRVLTHLNLENNLINEVQSGVRLSNLQHLNLCQNRINRLKFTEMGCSKLHSLCLDDGVVRLIHADTGFHQLVDLHEFTIKGQKSRNEKLAVEHLGSIGGCTKLQKLRIERCDLVSLEILAQFSELETLGLKEVYVETTLSPSFFNGCSNLRTLDLTGSAKLAQSILGNQDIRIKLQKLRTLTAKDCNIDNLNWIPERIDVKSPSRPLPFLSLLNVDISGNNNFNCDDQRVKQALCRFDNLKRTENPEGKIVNSNRKFILENANNTNCRQQMAAHSILQLDFTDCKEETNFAFSGQPDIATPSSKTDGESVTEEIFKPRTDEDAHSYTIFIVLGVLLIVFIVLVVLAFYYFKKRRCQTVKVPDCSIVTKQSFDNPQSVQSEV